MKTGAGLNRHRSKQDVGTPPEFLAALVDRFGPINLDLAANQENRVCEQWLGPGSQLGEDALAVDWAMLPERGVVMGHWFLNPPHGNVAPFVKKCAEQATSMPGAITVLVQAAVGTNWFADHVEGKALVEPIRPRLKFVGQKDPYPKDLMILVYGRWERPGFHTWRWDEGCPF